MVEKKRKSPSGDYQSKKNYSSSNKKSYSGGGGGAGGKSSSSSSASQSKRDMKHERQSQRKHAESVIQAKVLWNKLRQKKNEPDQVAKLMIELMDSIRGKVAEIALQHDASRVVQAAIQFGTKEQRMELFTELTSIKYQSTISQTGTGLNVKNKINNKSSDVISELAKNQYSHFTVLKCIQYGSKDAELMQMIVKSLKGHMTKLGTHAIGSKVVESLFLNFPHTFTAVLKREFYGAQFTLFANEKVNIKTENSTGTSSKKKQQQETLKELFETVSSEKQKEAAISTLRKFLNKGIEKSFCELSYFQDIFSEYVSVASPDDIRDIAPNVVDHSVHLMDTKPGTRVVAALASYGTPKDRKRIMKSFKGFTRSGLMHKDAYLAIIRLVQVTDDTVSIHKNIINELLIIPKIEKSDEKEDNQKTKGDDDDDENQQSPLLDIATDNRASKLLRMLLIQEENANDNDSNNSDENKEQQKQQAPRIFDKYELSVLFPNPTVFAAGKEIPTSKKDPAVRRRELLKFLKQPMIDMCIQHAHELLRSSPGSRVLRDVYAAFQPGKLVDIVADACSDALSVIKNEKVEKANDDDEEEQLPCLFEDYVGHRIIINMLLCDAAATDTEKQPLFATKLYAILKTNLLEVATQSNRGAYVIAALCTVPGIGLDVRKELKQNVDVIRKLTKDDSSGVKKGDKGYKSLLEEINGK